MSKQTYKVLLDAEWTLEDLMIFSRVYFQNYSFLYCLDGDADGHENIHIRSVLKDYELRSGLSYVNIYEIFRGYVTKEHRPKIKSIQYSSPGWMELVLKLDVASQVAFSIATFMGSLVAVGVAYSKLYKIYSNLNKMRQKNRNKSLKLDLENIKLVNDLNAELASGLGFKSLTALNDHTKDVEETSKLLMAHFRRIKKMASFVQNGKASFPEN